MAKPAFHARSHRPNSTDPIPATYAIKLFGDDEELETGDAFIWSIPKDVAGTFLRGIEAFVTTSGSSATQLQLENRGVTGAGSADVLSTMLEIDSGDLHNDDSTPQPVIDPTLDAFEWKEQLAFVVVSAGTGAMGLGVEVKFGPRLIRLP